MQVNPRHGEHVQHAALGTTVPQRIDDLRLAPIAEASFGIGCEIAADEDTMRICPHFHAPPRGSSHHPDRYRFDRSSCGTGRTFQRAPSTRHAVRGPIPDFIARFDLGVLGYIIVGMLLLAWGLSVVMWKYAIIGNTRRTHDARS